MPVKGNFMPPLLRLKLANECPNLLTRAELNPTYAHYKYYLLHRKHMNDKLYGRLMSLFKTLMKDLYENSSWGWKEEEKLLEWKHSKTRVILVTKVSDPPKSLSFGEVPEDEETIVGFMCFRFETGADKNECALYVYELHIDIAYQRQGLGEELMRMAEILALEFKMDKVMLTVFGSNQQALQFYKKLKYTLDKSSPPKADYSILSRTIKR